MHHFSWLAFGLVAAYVLISNGIRGFMEGIRPPPQYFAISEPKAARRSLPSRYAHAGKNGARQ